MFLHVLSEIIGSLFIFLVFLVFGGQRSDNLTNTV